MFFYDDVPSDSTLISGIVYCIWLYEMLKCLILKA